MKKILLAAVAALAITSCSQNEEFENPNQKAKIGFTSVVKKATRSIETKNDNFLGFTVSSYVTDGVYDGTTLGTAYMNGIAYTRANAAAQWITTDTETYYWPSENSGKNVQFFAYPTTDTSTYECPSSGYPSISFTVENEPTKQKDLVVAHEANVTLKSEGISNGTLTLNFKHVLTRINFAYVPADPSLTYKVTAISIADIKGGTGKYKFNENNGEWDLTGNTVTDVPSYTYKVKQAETKVTDKEYYSLADEDASWMLFPQKVNSKVISITYSTKQGEMEVFSGTKKITLPDDAEWTVGQNILYILTLPAGATKASVTTSVSNWNGVEENKQEVPNN